MPRFDLEYPREPYSTGNRYSSRVSHALKAIHGIVNAAPLVHVAFQPADSPFPALLPMIGQMGSFERPSAGLGDAMDLYLHGYVSMRLVNMARKETPSSGSEPAAPADAASKGLPVSIAATHLDGLVMALTPNAHSYNYRSAVLFGHATLVTDVAEKLYAMELITDSIVPARWANSRVPPNAAEMQSTSLLRVRIASATAKLRVGNAQDDRCDLNDDAVLNKVWAGVLPLYPVLGTPIPADYNRVEQLPAHLADFCADFNDAAKEQALEAAIEPPPTTPDKADD